MATTHNPSNFNPADYSIVGYFDNRAPVYTGGSMTAWAERTAEWREELRRVFGENWGAKVCRCAHCGNGNVRWITGACYRPTGEVVVFGADCTERLGFEDRYQFQLAQLKSRALAQSAALKVYEARQQFLADNPEIAAIYNAPQTNRFVVDVMGKLRQYGSLSFAQVSAVLHAVRADKERAERRAAEDAQPKGNAPIGRLAVSGVVVSTKDQESEWGVTVKMLVKLDNNAKVWVTKPAGVERGDRITVTATWSQSRDDQSFGFGSRPKLVSRQAATV